MFLSAESLRTGGYVISPDGLVLINPASIDLRCAEDIELDPLAFTLAYVLNPVVSALEVRGFRRQTVVVAGYLLSPFPVVWMTTRSTCCERPVWK